MQFPRPRALITGSASGIGLEAAKQLAKQGYHVIVADRNVAGATSAVEAMRMAGGSAEARALDLGDLSYIRDFAAQEVRFGLPLEVLINNAGLLPPPTRRMTEDGFELAFGVSFLGHFALTGLLLPSLLKGSRPRVISVSSLAHSSGRLDFDNLQLEGKYNWSAAYESSKLACLLFALELDRRVRLINGRLLSIAVHPGISRTPIGMNQITDGKRSLKDKMDALAFKLAMRFLGQTPAEGAAPLVYAAIDKDVQGGKFYGPTGFLQARGVTGEITPGKSARQLGLAETLWSHAEQLTGVSFRKLS